MSVSNGSRHQKAQDSKILYTVKGYTVDELWPHAAYFWKYRFIGTQLCPSNVLSMAAAILQLQS